MYYTIAMTYISKRVDPKKKKNLKYYLIIYNFKTEIEKKKLSKYQRTDYKLPI